MDLRQLRYFVTIVESGSFSRAAELLYVAQPALSRHVRELEEEFGCALLVRSARGISPTDSGRHLVQRAKALLAEAAGLRDEVRGIEACPSGPVVVGIPTSLGPLLSVPLALQVRQQLPEVQLRLTEGLSGHMREWLQDDKLDLGLLFDCEGHPGLAAEEVARERLRLVLPPGDERFAGRDRLTLAELLALPLILPGRPHRLREELESAALLLHRPLRVVLEMDALDQIKALVEAGAGYSVLSRRVADAPQPLPSLPITEPEIERRIFLAHARHKPLSVAARAVRTRLLALVGGIRDNGDWY